MKNTKVKLNGVRPRYKGSVNLKIIKYANIDKSELFFYDTEIDIFIGLGPMYKDSNFNTKGSCTDPEKIKRNQTLANNRAKSRIKKLVIENGLKYHCVTTYSDKKENRDNTLKDDCRDIVIYDNKLLVKKLSYHLKHKVDYVAVLEYQIDRFKKYGFKFFHVHIALNELIDERLFWSCWNSMKCMECNNYLVKEDDFKCNECKYFNGVTSYKDDDLDLLRTANYFSKYFSKGFEYNEFNQRKFNQKRYLSSFGLEMPKTINIAISEDEFKDIILNCEYIKSMGLYNNIGSRVVVENKFIDKYLCGKDNVK